MREYTENSIRILEPSDGKWLYNGETCSGRVYLGKNADASVWTEVDEYIEPSDEQDDEATESDYITALQDLGVEVDG